MKRHSLLALAVVIAVGALFTGCGEDSTSTAPTVTSLSALPSATGPVVSSRSLRLQSLSRAKTLNTWNSGWDNTKSGPACQTGEMIMRLLSDASQPDKILCYVGAMEAAGLFTASYDGTNKYYTLSNMGGGGGRSGAKAVGDMTIKFNIASTGGAITDFKMWMCETSKKGRPTSQTDYVSTSISNGVATVTSVGTHSGSGRDEYTASQRTVATGAFNSAGSWTSKSITNTGAFSGIFSQNASQHKQQLTLNQGPDYFILEGYFNGYYGGTTNTQTGEIYSKVEGVNLSALTNAALGGGSAKFSFSFSGETYTDTKSWNGNQAPLVPASDGVYFDSISSQSLPLQAVIPEPQFDEAEVWDCNTTGQTVNTIDMADADAMEAISEAITACGTKYGFNNNNPAGCSVAAF